MLNRYARTAVTAVLQPLARALVRRRVSPDVVTIIGTTGTLLVALTLYPSGLLFWGTILITVCVLADMLDGAMARELGRQSAWGAFLDSSLDRVADSAVFMGISLWFFAGGASQSIAVTSVVCLVLSSLVSYVKARAEAVGATANLGIAERPERLLVTLVATGLVGLGLPHALLLVALLLLAGASAFTVFQRVATVYRQLAASTNSVGSG